MRCKQAWWVMFWMNGMEDPKPENTKMPAMTVVLVVIFIFIESYGYDMIFSWFHCGHHHHHAWFFFVTIVTFMCFFIVIVVTISISTHSTSVMRDWYINTLGSESSQVWTVVVFESFGCSLVFENMFQRWCLLGDRWIGEFSVFHQEAARKKKEKERTREREMQHYFHPCLHSHCPNHEGSSHEHSHRQNTNPPVITNMAGWKIHHF